MARIARDECSGTSVNEGYLEAMRQRMKMTEDDAPAFVVEAHNVVDMLRHGLAEAPSRQSWCDTVYRLYGPDGKLIPGLLGH